MSVGEALSYQVDRSGPGGGWRLRCIGGRVLLGAVAVAPPSSASPERLARRSLARLLLLLLTGLGRWVMAFRAVLTVGNPYTCISLRILRREGRVYPQYKIVRASSKNSNGHVHN